MVPEPARETIFWFGIVLPKSEISTTKENEDQQYALHSATSGSSGMQMPFQGTRDLGRVFGKINTVDVARTREIDTKALLDVARMR